MSKKNTMSLADLFNRLINQVKKTMRQGSNKNRNVRRNTPRYRTVGKPAIRNNTRAMPPKLVKPSLSNYLNSPFYRTKTPDQSKLKNRSGAQQEKNNKERPISMRGNKRTGNYNGKFHDIDYSGKIITRTRAVHDRYNDDTLSEPADFLKGNIKQTLGGFESAIGTIGKNIGGYNWLDASREQQKDFSDEMKNRKNVTKEEVKKAWDESRKKGIAVAEEMKKKGDDSMVDHADKLLTSGSADLERVKKGKNAVQRTLIDLASSVTQFGIDAGLGAVTGGGILPIMAIRSSGTAASEARQEGASDLEQLLYGGGKGTLDVLTEKTMSLVKPLTTVMKKGALDDYSERAINKLLKSQIMDKVIKSPEGKNITYHALKAGVAATGEGAEEMVAEALTTPLKNAIYTDGEKIDVKSVLYSGLQGALTGVVLGGVGEAADYNQGKNLVKNEGFDDKNNVAALIDEGLQSDESTPAHKIANQLKLAVESGKKITPGQILAQKRANQEAIKQEAFAIERQKYIAERAAEREGLSPVSIDIDNNHTIIGGATAQRLKETTRRVSARLIDAHSKDKGTAVDTAASISRIAVGLGDGHDFSTLLPTAGNESARQIYMEETGSVLPNTNEGTRAVLSKSNMMNRLMMRQEETKFQKSQQKQKIMREAETSLGKNGLSAFSNTLQLSKGKSDLSIMQEFKKYYDGGIANYPVENIYRMSKHDHLPYPARMAAWQAGYRDSESRMQAQDAGKSDRSARYSIDYTSENQPVVILDKDILENVPEENWKSTVRDEMKKFSEGIPVHGKLIKVNAKGRKEFTKGKTTEFYRKNNETVYKDKLNSGSNADEIVWASTDYSNENPKHLRKDDFVDFARGKVLLQSGENKYNASVIIGKRSNGELALYDIVDYKPANFVLKSSKKDADPQFKENNSYRRSYAASSNNSISNSALKNNRNELKQKNSGTFKSQVSLRVVPKKTQDCLKNLAKALNVDIQLDPVLKHDANGFYKDGVIHLSAKTDNPVLSVFKHELTHHIQETAPIEYQKLKEFVMQEYYKGDRKAFQAAIDEKVQAYTKQGERLTRDQAIDEIIANSAERFLIDEAEIAKVVRQDRSLGQAILDAIRKLVKLIKGLLEEAEAIDRGYSKFLEELGILEKAEKLWMDALEVSVKSAKTPYSNYGHFSLKDINIRESDIKAGRKSVTRMEPVTELTGEEFKKGEKGLTQQVSEYFDALDNTVHNEQIGDIDLTERGVKDSIAHGIGRKKAIAFKAIPDVLENGRIIDYQKNWKGRKYDTIVIAAPIKIGREAHYVGAIIVRDESQDLQRYYLHEVLIEKRNDSPFKTGSQWSPGGDSYPSLISLLQKVQNIKNSEGQFSLKDSNGKQLSDQQTEFFKDSQFKDPDGNLLPMYHGTAEEFWTFDHRKAQDLTGRKMGLGAGKGKFYFSQHKAVANVAAQSAESMGKGSKVNVKEVYLNAKKVMDRSEYQELLENEYEKVPEANPQNEYYDYQERDRAIGRVDKRIKRQGYDGVFDKESGEAFVFDSNQIKDVSNESPTKDPDILYSLKVDSGITYDSLVKKPDMKISIASTSLDDVKNLSRKEIVSNAKKLLSERVGEDDQGRIKIYNNDTKKDIVVGKPGIEHGLDRNYDYTAIVSMHLDSYLKHAIKINEAAADNGRKFDCDILLGYGENQNGEKIPAYFVVSKLSTGQDELVEFGSLYSVRAKKIVEDSAQSSPGVQSRTSTTISISDLLEGVNKMYSDILPKSVADHYRNERQESKLGKSVKYSLKEYSNHQKASWASSKSIVVYENDEQLSQFIDDALNKKNLNKKIYFGKAPDELADKVFQETGIDIKNKNVALPAKSIVHIIGRHGSEDVEAPRRQSSITKEDFFNIPETIENPDDIKLDSKLYNGRPVLKFIKNQNGKTTIVSYVSQKHMDLAIQTMYAGSKKRRPSEDNELNPSPPPFTSETRRGMSPPENALDSNINQRKFSLINNSIRKNDEKSNGKKYSLKDHLDEQSLINDENQQKRSKYQIKEGMTDRERYEELKDARITPAQYNQERMAEDIQVLTELGNTYKSRAEKILKPLAERFGVFKTYYNEAIELEFNYSKGSLNESVFKQATRAGQFDTFAKMLSCFDEMIKNAVPIEIHKDKYKGTMRESGDLRRVFVLVSGYYDNGMIPVQLEIKEFYGNKSNKLYITVTLDKVKKMTIMGQSPTSKSRYNYPMSSFNISLSELFTNINTSDIDFLKYVPDQFLNKSQMEGKREGLRKEREKLESLKQGVRYSLKNQADGGAESNLMDTSPGQSHEKKVRNARLKTIEELTLQVEQLRQEKKLPPRKLPDHQNLINQSNNLVRTLLGGKRTNHKLVNIAANSTKAIFKKLKQGDDRDAIEQAYTTGREIVESLDLVKDPLYKEYIALRDYFETIRKVEKQDEFEDYDGMLKLQSGYLKQNERDGMSANRVYKELRRLCPILFSEDISNPADQLREIGKIRNSLKPYALMLSDETAERLIKETATNLLEIAYNGTTRRIFTNKQKVFFIEYLGLLKQQQKEAKNKVEEKLYVR